MKIPYQINPTNETITMYLEGEFKPTTVTREHASYSAIYTALLGDDHSKVPSFLKKSSKIEKTVDWSKPKLKAQGAEVVGGELFINGRKQSGRLATIATELARKSGDISPILRFLELLDKNPSAKSKEEAYDFLQHKGLPIMPNGMVRGYKGVNQDNWSVTGNKNTTVLQGKVSSDGRIWNGIGETIEVQRNSVDDDRSVGCSHGLHVGTYEYAWRFAPKLLLVEFSPEDIVSVPTECDCQKLRCCKYTVLEEYTANTPISDTVPSYDVSELKATILDILDGDIPNQSLKSVSNLKSYVRAEIDKAFDEVLDSDFDKAIEAFDLSEFIQESSAAQNVVEIEERIWNYVSKKKSPTIGMIQKSLNPTKVGCSEISGIASKLGLKVYSNSRGISNWTVRA